MQKYYPSMANLDIFFEIFIKWLLQYLINFISSLLRVENEWPKLDKISTVAFSMCYENIGIVKCTNV